MKRIVFLIIASLLVIGLVLPGCDGGNGNGTDTRPAITIGVIGPTGYAQGDHHQWGAELAADEINGTDPAVHGVDVGGTLYKIEVQPMNSNEILTPSGETGVTQLEANIADLDFVVGGFRTEAVFNYREVVVGPDGADKIFINCGAATEALQYSVVEDYDNYKYWFKGTPPNELFLAQAGTKLTGMILAAARAYNATYEPTVALITENALWADLSTNLYVAKLGPMGYGWLVGGPPYVWRPSPLAQTEEMNTILDEIAAYDPDIIIAIMSGPCGVTYANRVGAYMPNVLTTGINVEAQRTEFPDSAQYAEGIIFLDVVVEGVNVTDSTADFVSDFMAVADNTDNEPPIYTAATYDAILSLVEAIEAEDSITNTDAIIAWMENLDNARTGALAKSGYYPQWDGSSIGAHPFFGLPDIPATTEALNETQVLEIYPWLDDAKYWDGAASILPWAYDQDDWTMPWHTTHDLIYGPEWATGVASQWQDVGGGELEKVCIWPKPYLAGPPYSLPTTLEGWLAIIDGVDVPTMGTLQELGLWDQWGWWHFEYPGTGTIELTDWITWISGKYGW